MHIPAVAFWCLVIAALAVAVLLFRQWQITVRLRKEAAVLACAADVRDREVRYLADVRLPALLDSMFQPVAVPGLADERLADTEFAKSLQKVMDRFTAAVEQTQSRVDHSAKAALKASMRALQALANEQQVAISEMQERHDNPEVLQDLLEIDHTNAQFGRRAQAIAVLCGSWPGRQRSASDLTDIVRGATSRIRDYRRVRVYAQIDIAVVSRAVEPVVLAVAELLDNAARHSQPNTMVEVNLQPAHNGACIVIDDAGVGMDSQEVEQATRMLSGEQPVDVARLGDPPQFGFAVISVLCRRYGFRVSVDTRSPYGGVRAVVFLPSALLTHVDHDSVSTPKPAPSLPAPAPKTPQPAPTSKTPQPAPAPDAPQPQAAPAADQPAPPSTTARSSTASGLPKRRRRQPLAGTAAAAAPTPPQPETQGRTAEETARRMGAFARGTRSGRMADRDDDNERTS